MKLTFQTSKRLDNWMEKHRSEGCKSRATAGEQFVWEFLPSAIVDCQTIKCLCCGAKFTDYVEQEERMGQVTITHDTTKNRLL